MIGIAMKNLKIFPMHLIKQTLITIHDKSATYMCTYLHINGL